MLRLPIKNTKDTGRVCLRVSQEGTSIAVSKLSNAQLHLLNCQFFKHAELQEAPHLLSDYIHSNQLAGANCSLILAPSDYQLLLTEAPNVGPSEMCEALWWKVKDLVAFDYDNALIDFLDLPEDSSPHQARKIYAVVANKEKVQERVAWAEGLSLTPITVEIPETALLHLVADLCQDIVGTSVLYLDSEQSLLMLMSQGQMYLSRTLQYNYLDKLDAIALDLQRSMDYYESQLGKSPCLKVIVLPQQDLESPIMRTLIENMGAEITTINLNNIISVEEELSIELRHHCFIAIAGALRLDQKVKK